MLQSMLVHVNQVPLSKCSQPPPTRRALGKLSDSLPRHLPELPGPSTSALRVSAYIPEHAQEHDLDPHYFYVLPFTTPFLIMPHT